MCYKAILLNKPLNRSEKFNAYNNLLVNDIFVCATNSNCIINYKLQ